MGKADVESIQCWGLERQVLETGGSEVVTKTWMEIIIMTIIIIIINQFQSQLFIFLMPHLHRAPHVYKSCYFIASLYYWLKPFFNFHGS